MNNINELQKDMTVAFAHLRDNLKTLEWGQKEVDEFLMQWGKSVRGYLQPSSELLLVRAILDSKYQVF